MKAIRKPAKPRAMYTMKRAFCLLLILLFIPASEVKSEGNGSAFGMQEITVEILRDKSTIIATSPDIPDLAVSLSGRDAGVISPDAIAAACAFRPDVFPLTLRSFFTALQTWAEEHEDRAEETGLFAGDAFIKAKTKKAFTVDEDGMNTFLGMLDDSDYLCLKPYLSLAGTGSSLSGAVYNRGAYCSVQLMNSGQCVLTLSADLSDPDETYLVLGFGNDSELYYHEISIVRDGLKTLYELNLYTGEEMHFNPEKQILCQKIYADFEACGETTAFSGTVDSLVTEAPVHFTGMIGECEHAEAPEGIGECSLSQLLQIAAIWFQITPQINVIELLQMIPGM